MDRSPDKENILESSQSNPGGGKKSGGGGGGGVGGPKGHRPSRRMKSPHEGSKQDALLTSPSDSGDQARLQSRPPLQPPNQPAPFYSLMPVPHFIASNDVRNQPMYQMQNPPPTQQQPPQFEHVSMAGNGYFDVHHDHLNQPFFEPQLEDEAAGIKAVVEKQGYISLHLRYDAHVDIAPNQAIRIVNHRKGITLALSGCATQMALVHPQGRVLQYNSRIEIQTEDFLSIKNAKMWPRGVSFTANNCALVYLVDQAGARSTTDTFHDLYADNIADTVFLKSCQFAADHPNHAIAQSINYLEKADYWRTDSDLDCWLINDVNIKQTPDGLVSVERKHGCEMFTLKTSPSNGKARLQSSFLYLTASMGEESHIFVKSNDRRLHYNGHAFVVRNAGHSAGFDESGLLRIW